MGCADAGEKSPDVGEVSPDVGETLPEMGEAFPDLGERSPEMGETFPDLGASSPDVGETVPNVREVFPEMGGGFAEAKPRLAKNAHQFAFFRLCRRSLSPTLRNTCPAETASAMTYAPCDACGERYALRRLCRAVAPAQQGR